MQVGDLSVKIGADTSGLNKGLGDAKKSVSIFDQSIGETVGSIKTLHAAVAATVVQIASFVKSSMDAVNAQTDLAKSLNTSYASLVAFNRAAQLTGVQGSTQMLMIFNKNISDAASGTGPFADALGRLNLNAQQLLELPIDERVKLFGQRFAELIPVTQQAAFAAQLFGRQGQTALELLRDTSAITAAQQEVQNLGLALSNIEVEMIGAADDEMSIFGQTMNAVGQQIALSLAPAIAELSRRFKEVFIDSGAFKNILFALDAGIRIVIATVRDFWNILNYIPDSIGAIVGKSLQLIGMIPGFSNFAKVGDELVANFSRTWEALQGGGALGRTLSGMDDLKAKWEEVGRAAAEAGFVSGAGGGGMGAEQKKELQDRVNAIRDALRSEQEMQAKKYEEDVLALQKARDAGLEIEGGYHAALQAITEDHIMKMNEIAANSPEAKKAEELAKNLETLKQSFLDEEGLQIAKYERELELLRESLMNKVLTEEEFNLLFEEVEERHWEKMAEIRNKGASDLVKIAEMWRKKDYQGALQGFAQMTAASANASKEMFNLNKAAAIASATIKAYEAISGAYAFGAKIGGPPVGAAFAAAAGAFQFAQLRAIASQQFSGAKGSAGAPAPSAVGGITPGGTPGATAAGAAFGGGQVVSINLTGEIFGRDQVRDLIGQINEAISDGAVLRIA
jgi:hypothetical protein